MLKDKFLLFEISFVSYKPIIHIFRKMHKEEEREENTKKINSERNKKKLASGHV